jgi:hypothetical protein
LVPLNVPLKKLKNYYIKYIKVFNTIKTSKMQTDNSKINEQNSCILASPLKKEDFKFVIELEDSSSSDSDSDVNEQIALNESFRLTYASDNENENENENEPEVNKVVNYICTMCNLVVKSRSSFCNASCEKKYLKNEK